MSNQIFTLFVACLLFIVISMWINKQIISTVWAKWCTFNIGMLVWTVLLFLIGYSLYDCFVK